MVGKTEDVIAEYLNTKSQLSKEPISERKDRRGTGRVTFTHCDMVHWDEKKRTLKFTIKYKNNTNIRFENVKLSMEIWDQNSVHLVNATNSTLNQKIDINHMDGTINLEIYDVNIGRRNRDEMYHCDLFLATDTANSEILDQVQNACSFEINNENFYPGGKMPPVPSRFLFNFKYT